MSSVCDVTEAALDQSCPNLDDEFIMRGWGGVLGYL